jgi:hypothetical protein
MGLDDILQEKQDRAAARRADWGNLVREAQTRRLAFTTRVEMELCAALKATGDPALSSPVVQKIIGQAGESSAVLVDCQGRHGTTHFQATVMCEPGAEATCSPIKVTLPTGAHDLYRATMRSTPHPRARVSESWFGIDSADLHTFVRNLAGRS